MSRFLLAVVALGLASCENDPMTRLKTGSVEAAEPNKPTERNQVTILYEIGFIGFAQFGKVCDEGRAVYLGREQGGGSSIAIVENAKECTPADGGA